MGVKHELKMLWCGLFLQMDHLFIGEVRRQIDEVEILTIWINLDRIHYSSLNAKINHG